MQSPTPIIKGIYLIGAYLCLLALILIAPENLSWFVDLSKWTSLFVLLVFFYLNTAIDSRFEKYIFYGLILSAISCLMPLAEPIIGVYSNHLILVSWIIAYFSYSRALISITSGSSTILFQHKWLAALIFVLGLLGLYFLLSPLEHSFSNLIPWLCLGFGSIVYFMASINLFGQLSSGYFGSFVIAALLLLGYNCISALNISSNISIFDSENSIVFYLGQLILVFTSVKISAQFRDNDFADISNVLKNK